MSKKVVYVNPNCETSYDEVWAMTDSEKVTFAKNDNNAAVYSLPAFQMAFNNELISDLGFIFFVEG